MIRFPAFCAVAVLVSGGLLVGCAAPYVNVPHQSGDIAADNPNLRTVRDVEVAALRAVYESSDLPGPILIRLPAGSDALTYVAAADAIDDEVVVTPSDESVKPASTLTIDQVRVRGWDAEVDVIRPVSGSVRQLVTVYLERQPFSGWTVRRQHVWRIPVEPAEPLAEGDEAEASGAQTP